MLGVMGVIMLPSMAVWAIFGSSLRTFLARPRGRVVFNAAMALALAATGVTMLM
jgi:threonine/homoserine/homoserine lactone efflux protein